MKLSIITINRNNAFGLRKTIESVVVQTYKDFEYIIIDGASTDNSVDVIKMYADNISYWVSEPDNGIFDAMNKGIMRAKGNYLLFLNSGDFLVDIHVLEQVIACSNNNDILCGQCLVSDGDKIIWRTIPEIQYTLDYFLKGSIPHQATFIKRNLFDKYGLYRTDLQFMSDWEFFVRTIILYNVKVTPLFFDISNYNTNGISSNSNNFEKMNLERSIVYSDLNLQNIIKDYFRFYEFKRNNQYLLWMLNKKYLIKFIKILYQIAKYIKK